MSLVLDKCVPAKTTEELIALLRSGNAPQRAEAAASLANNPEAVSELMRAAKKDKTERVRDLALTSLLDTLLNREHFITDTTVGVFIHATLKGGSKPLRDTGEISLFTLAHDHPEKVLPLLSKAEEKEKGSPEVGRITSTISIVRSLCELSEKPKMPEVGKKNSPAEIEKGRREPPRIRAVA